MRRHRAAGELEFDEAREQRLHRFQRELIQFHIRLDRSLCKDRTALGRKLAALAQREPGIELERLLQIV